MKWSWVVFIRVLDAIITNCKTVMTYLTGSRVKKTVVITEIINFLTTRYKGHRVLQQKITTTQMSHGKDIRIHFSKELEKPAKKIECIVCGVKSKNFCVQCSETRHTQVGFCGSSQCIQKHNETTARLLDE